METGSLSRDAELLARLVAPPDLHDGVEALDYWRGRRQRLPWYRRRAKREAAEMIVVWERRVRAALLQQPGVPLATRFHALRLVAAGPLRRWTRRGGFALAAASLLVLVLAPALLVLELLVKLL